MKVCIVNSFYPPWIGGAETYVSNIARHLVKHGHEVTVYCAHNPLPIGESMEEGVRVRRMRAPLRLYGTPIAISPLSIFFDDFDVIHCNFPSPYLASLFAVLSRIRGIPAVLTWHNDLPPVTSAAGALVRIHDLFAPAYLDQYKKIIATTTAYAKSSRILSTRRNQVVVVSNGVDTHRFNPSVDGQQVRAMHGLSGNKIALFVGALTRWHAYKGLDNLIRAMSIVNREAPEARLLVVGGGELAEKSKTIANGLGLAGIVTFAGNVSERILPNYYAACDVFVLPSRDRSEGYGLALLEAMATGKPVVGSRVGGIVDVIKEGETGLLVAPNDYSELARALLSLFRDEESRDSMGRAGRKFAEERDWERIACLVEAVYADVILAK